MREFAGPEGDTEPGREIDGGRALGRVDISSEDTILGRNGSTCVWRYEEEEQEEEEEGAAIIGVPGCHSTSDTGAERIYWLWHA
ncbi:hypothetical protein EVG20_g8521 [Dentipellis fragilis]|uniref:Uncharacterized protein n=1 Tax=Dentipellis fragilis TaxID=205917 RepID=A0A4Y9Y9H9_9AGAM|nr:hypothetical protein EVG20_g8521 [Dentipellis fragilis]